MSDTLVLGNDDLIFQEETPPEISTDSSLPPWKVLIADDDETVHSSTLYALGNVSVLDRQLKFFHAYSASEAREILQSEPNIAVILLDVVMESDDAGLNLVHQIRNELQLEELRIILRTGQPGYAPEIEVIRDYDINDYKTKAELTRTKLFTTLTAALRSYMQIRTINANRQGLDLIVHSSAELIATQGIKDFAQGVITQIAALLGLDADGVVCARSSEDDAGHPCYTVVAAAGPNLDSVNQAVESLADDAMRNALLESLRTHNNNFQNHGIALYFPCKTGRDMCVYLRTPCLPSKTHRGLLAVFCSNISVCLDNLSLFTNLKSQAYFDQLLMLPNRNHLIEEVDNASTNDNFNQMAMLLIDIDHFAELNHALGHQYGDLLLKQIAERLRKHCNNQLFLARNTGDCFALFGTSQVINTKALVKLLADPFSIHGNEQVISATFGLAQMSEIDGGGQEAIKAASTALNQAKQTQRGQIGVYTREVGTQIQSRVKLLQKLRASFEHERLFLHYQPQVSLPDGKPIGCEALIRWRDDDGRYIPPDVFIPLAERSGIITPIGEWVMRTAFFQAKQLHAMGFPQLRMAVNVSMIQFRSEGFLAMLDQALADSGVDPTLIELEITESVAMLEADYMLQMLEQIKARGLQVAIDDFGTGFSSLSYLQRLKIDRLKIDRSFVDQICHSEDAKSIAEMVIELGKSLHLNVIAEGVEDLQQAERLSQLGCHEAQGFVYAKPMEATALVKWLLNQQPQRPSTE
ncbi:MAG: EAL domain-containing protein [Halopseudomonas sp.]